MSIEISIIISQFIRLRNLKKPKRNLFLVRFEEFYTLNNCIVYIIDNAHYTRQDLVFSWYAHLYLFVPSQVWINEFNATMINQFLMMQSEITPYCTFLILLLFEPINQPRQPTPTEPINRFQ